MVEGDIASYELLRMDESGNQTPLYPGSSDGLYIDYNLDPSSVYNYKIRAIHEGGESSEEWSGTVSEQTLDLLVPTISSINSLDNNNKNSNVIESKKFVKLNPLWKLSMQYHKVLGIP